MVRVGRERRGGRCQGGVRGRLEGSGKGNALIIPLANLRLNKVELSAPAQLMTDS